MRLETTTIDPQMTLGALVNANPELAREFERRGLDYCCGGGNSLAEACADLGLDPTATVSELIAVSTAAVDVGWSTMGPPPSSITSRPPTTAICGTRCPGCRRSSPRS